MLFVLGGKLKLLKKIKEGLMRLRKWWEPRNDGLEGARGLLVGVILSSGFWLIIIFLIWIIRKS